MWGYSFFISLLIKYVKDLRIWHLNLEAFAANPYYATKGTLSAGETRHPQVSKTSTGASGMAK